jgi:hypothetical protein
LDLSRCTVVGCQAGQTITPSLNYDPNLLLNSTGHQRRVCDECPPNEFFSEVELDMLVGADVATLKRLKNIVLSGQTHTIVPGVVYITFEGVHHVVIDLEASIYRLRNIIPPILTPEMREQVRITPSYCFTPKSLVVVTADYHGLNGSNKTEDGRDIFFHLGRAELYQKDGRFDIDVISDPAEYAKTSISWGGGPIFIWDGRYDYNPKNEWFSEEALTHYGTTKWGKMTVGISQDRKYLFLTASYGRTLEEHAQNIIELGKRWNINIDRAMRFDGSESTYVAIRLGRFMVPVLNLEEPLIVNCLAVEKVGDGPF